MDGRFPDMPFRVVIGASERGSDSNGTDSDREDTVNIAAAYLVRRCEYFWCSVYIAIIAH